MIARNTRADIRVSVLVGLDKKKRERFNDRDDESGTGSSLSLEITLAQVVPRHGVKDDGTYGRPSGHLGNDK